MLDVTAPEQITPPRLTFALQKDSPWTPEKIERLVLLRAEGKSASVIGRELDVSRNAVAGQCYRLEIPFPHKPKVPKVKAAPRGKPGVRQPPIFIHAAPVVEPDSGSRCSLIGLTNKNCHHPIGEPLSPDFMFCGAIAVQDKPYCLFHCAKNYQSVRR